MGLWFWWSLSVALAFWLGRKQGQRRAFHYQPVAEFLEKTAHFQTGWFRAAKHYGTLQHDEHIISTGLEAASREYSTNGGKQ